MKDIYLILQGLNCANCLNKIENDVMAIKDVSKTESNFAYQEIKITHTNSSKEDIIKKVESIVTKIEPNVKVIERSKLNDFNNTETTNKKRFILIILGVLFFILALYSTNNYLLNLSFYIISYFLLSFKVVLIAVKNFLKGRYLDENFLMTIASLGAFAIGEYPEAIAVMIFYQIGEYLEDIAVNKSRSSIKSLIEFKVETANLLVGHEVKEILPEQIKIGDVILIKPGEKVPLDGVVLDGSAELDTSSLTGESVPMFIKKGDKIISGAINKGGLLKVRVEKDYSNSTINKVMELIKSAVSKKAPVEKFITKFAKIYTPIVIFLAVALAIIPPILIESATFTEWIRRALVFLVVSCPCALVISVPLGFFTGLGRSSKSGILIKGTNYLQVLEKIDTVVFDKTGTLTKGIFNVIKVEPFEDVSEEEILAVAYEIEKLSNHPVGRAIVDYVNDKKYKLQEYNIVDFCEIAGLGIKAKGNKGDIIVGKSKLLEDEGIQHISFNGVGSVVYVALRNRYLGYIVVSDEIKDDSFLAIENIKKMGIKNILMLTGDRKEVAEEVADKLGITEVFSELLPHEKVEKIEEIYNRDVNAKILFAGDGLNDVAVLARTDIGVAMGGIGSDLAIEMADVTIMDDKVSKIPDVIKIAKDTMGVVKQNIAFSLFIKFLVLILAVFDLANMWLAVFVDVGVTLLVILNSGRIILKN